MDKKILTFYTQFFCCLSSPKYNICQWHHELFKFPVVSGLPGTLYSICSLGVSTILESEKIITMWPLKDLIALTRKGSRGVGAQPPFFNKQDVKI